MCLSAMSLASGNMLQMLQQILDMCWINRDLALSVPGCWIWRRHRRRRSISPGRKSIAPAPGSFPPAGFGGLRARNPAGRTNPGAGALGFRLGTIDRSSGAESHQPGTVESFCNSPTDGLKSKGSVLISRSVYTFGRISGDPREGELS